MSESLPEVPKPPRGITYNKTKKLYQVKHSTVVREATPSMPASKYFKQVNKAVEYKRQHEQLKKEIKEQKSITNEINKIVGNK